MGREFGLNLSVNVTSCHAAAWWHCGSIPYLLTRYKITFVATDARYTVKAALGMHAEVHASQCQSCADHQRCGTRPWAYAS